MQGTRVSHMQGMLPPYTHGHRTWQKQVALLQTRMPPAPADDTLEDVAWLVAGVGMHVSLDASQAVPRVQSGVKTPPLQAYAWGCGAGLGEAVMSSRGGRELSPPSHQRA